MPFVLHVSDMRVTISGLPEEAERGVRAVWRLASPIVPAAYEARFEVERSGDDDFTVRTDGELRATGVARADLLATVEAVLYHDIEAWTPPRRLLLHAAAAHLEGVTYLLVGASGAGKSSLVYALLERGARYLTDELTLVEGGVVWGVPRVPQLDPIPLGAHLPSGFPAADLESYVFRSVDGARALPLLSLEAEQVARAPYPRATVRLVFPGRAERTVLEALAPSEALRQLAAEVRRPATPELAALLTRPALALAWRTPTEGVDALLAEDDGALPER